ncbi:MFS transporter [Anaerobiospirillum thomasii]|uniref:Nucleoside transporter yegT n=1 Tax=Anaerobiospirillum thomasii TaxID=179995 RepID=A0A2X0VN90_9GAMM|nr:MFS transporter [Anaerobiospirillum thomasii]SPT70988.1 Putative nucleoside transporter yegT [Anaerobiospirillum thomasii]
MKVVMARLMAMMFVQYVVQGAWVLTLGLVLSSYNMADIIGNAYAVLGVATILSPMFVGMVADRFFATEKVLALMHLLLAAVVYLTSMFIVGENKMMVLAGLFFVGLIYYPTVALTNSIAFSHVDGSRHFPVIRMFGSIGYVALGLFIGEMGWSGDVMTWYVASITALIMSAYCLTLPHTPPKMAGREFSMRDLLCLDAFALFKDKYFTIMMLSILVLMVPKTAYSAYIPVFLKAIGFDNAASMMQIGVAMEVLFVFLIPFFLLKFGFKVTLMTGMICWAIRSALFAEAAVSGNTMLVIIGLVLQGICWDFFFSVADIYADKKAGENIKAQAQSLRFIASNGVGLFFASSVCGYIFNSQVSDTSAAGLPQWYSFWYIAGAIAAAVFVAFLVFFKDDVSNRQESK